MHWGHWAGYADARANLKNLQPFVARHWRKGVLGAFLILFNSLLGFPQPLINRFLIDDVILGRQLNLLAVVSALDRRRRTGKGGYIDAAQIEATDVHVD